MSAATTGRALFPHYGRTLVVRAIIAIIFGIVAIVWTAAALRALMYLFGAFALVDGVVALATAFEERGTSSRWWMQLLKGLTGVILGILVIVWPSAALQTLLMLAAIWAIVTGIMEIGVAFPFKRSFAHEWTLAVGGVLSVLLGLVLIVFPGLALSATMLLIGIYAIVFGTLLLVRAFQFRSASMAA